MIFETYHPSAVYRITQIDAQQQEMRLWAGTDPYVIENGVAIAGIPVKPKIAVKKIKIYVDSPAVRGWNEIDAVGLRDQNNTIHGAIDPEAQNP